MKPERFIGIMLLTLLLSCELEDQVDQKVGEVTFETNQYMMNSSFGIDIYIDGKKVETQNKPRSNLLSKKLEVGIHDYEVKIYNYNGLPSKSVRGRFLIKENKNTEVFVDFKKYNSWE